MVTLILEGFFLVLAVIVGVSVAAIWIDERDNTVAAVGASVALIWLGCFLLLLFGAR